MLNVLTLFAELIFVTGMILLFYRLKPKFGLAPLYILLGSFQYFQTILYKSTFISIFSIYHISPAGTILFCATFFTILLVYIKEGVYTTRNLIMGIVLANLAFTFLTAIVKIEDNVMKDIIFSRGINPDIFVIDPVLFIVDAIVLTFDAFILVILYELLYSKKIRLNLFLRLLVTLLIILNFDAVVFSIGSFWNDPNMGNIILAQMISKSIVACFLACFLFLYLRYFDKTHQTENSLKQKGNEDIFSILTYQGKFEKLKTEKAISDVELRKIISDKTTELEKSIRRFTILTSIRELRIDKFTLSDQAAEILKNVQLAFETDACSIHLIVNKELKLLAGIGIPNEKMEKALPLTMPYINEIISKKKALAIANTSTDPKFKNLLIDEKNKIWYNSCAGSPLLTGDKVVGVIKLYSLQKERIFTTLELDHLQMVANQVGYTLENAKLFEQNEKHKEILVKQIFVRKKMDDAIKESEEKFRTLFQQAADGIFLVDKDGNYLVANKHASKITGYSIDELKKMNAVDIVDKDDLKKNPLKLEEIKTGEPIFIERVICRKDHTKIHVEISAKLMDNGQVITIMRDITDRKKAEEKINLYTHQLKQLTGHLLSIREDERKRIGREIHDDLGQQLTAIKMDIAWIDKKIPEDEVVFKEKLKSVIMLLDESNQAVRRILSELRPSILDDYGLLDALKWHGKSFTDNTGIPVQIITSNEDFKLPEPISTCIYRIFQESLTNVTRYAKAKKVITTIHINPHSIEVSIKDDGMGFDIKELKTRRSFGIMGMKERVATLSGKFEILSAIGKGTMISIEIPY